MTNPTDAEVRAYSNSLTRQRFDAMYRLDTAIIALDAFGTLLALATEHAAECLAPRASGLGALVDLQVTEFRHIESELAQINTESDEAEASRIAEEVARVNHSKSKIETEIEALRAPKDFANSEQIDAAEIAAALKVDPEIVERIVSELTKAKAPADQPSREGRRGRAARG